MFNDRRTSLHGGLSTQIHFFLQGTDICSGAAMDVIWQKFLSAWLPSSVKPLLKCFLTGTMLLPLQNRAREMPNQERVPSFFLDTSDFQVNFPPRESISNYWPSAAENVERNLFSAVVFRENRARNCITARNEMNFPAAPLDADFLLSLRSLALIQCTCQDVLFRT